MNSTALEQLKNLKIGRSRTSPFPGKANFLEWADDVQPLLDLLSPPHAADFRMAVINAGVHYTMTRGNGNLDTINQALGIVDQALAACSLQLQVKAQLATVTVPLEVPEKITLDWLFKHAPVGLTLSAFGVVTAAFLAGIWVAQSKLGADLISRMDATPVKPEVVQSQPLDLSSSLPPLSKKSQASSPTKLP
jgi:hypothetical protein